MKLSLYVWGMFIGAILTHSEPFSLLAFVLALLGTLGFVVIDLLNREE